MGGYKIYNPKVTYEASAINMDFLFFMSGGFNGWHNLGMDYQFLKLASRDLHNKEDTKGEHQTANRGNQILFSKLSFNMD